MTTTIAIVLVAAAAFVLGRWYGRAEQRKRGYNGNSKIRIARLEVTAGSVFLQPDTIVEHLYHTGGVIQFPPSAPGFITSIVKTCPANCPDCAANRGADAELDQELKS